MYIYLRIYIDHILYEQDFIEFKKHLLIWIDGCIFLAISPASKSIYVPFSLIHNSVPEGAFYKNKKLKIQCLGSFLLSNLCAKLNGNYN